MHRSMSSTTSLHNSNSRIARPSSVESTQTTTNSNKKKQIKQPSSRLSKSQSMHRLLLTDDQEPMHRRALLSRATTTPVPRPSSLIKRFSDHTAMKRCSSLMSPAPTEPSGGLVDDGEPHYFRLGQRVCVPSLNVVGTVRYFGETKFKEKGAWVGIELDLKGTGKNDGSIQGFRYFSCAPDTGLFVQAAKAIGLEEHCKRKITPRISKTTTTTRQYSSSTSTSTAAKRKSMIVTPTAPLSTTVSSAPARQNRSAVATANATAAPLNSSKSARALSSTRSPQTPLPTRSSPSGATKKASTSTRTSNIKPALKKSSSMNTDCHHHHHGRVQQPQRSTPVASVSTAKHHSTEADEIERMQALLEKSRQEQRALSQQMDGQEAAWERLVSVKESYAVQVQEKDDEIARLTRLLEGTHQATHELTKITSERDAALSRASMSEAMEKQHSKVIERLNLRVHTLQQQQEVQQQEMETKQRNHAAQMEQMRKQLAESDEAAALVERECNELRQEHFKALKSFDTSVRQREQEYADSLTSREATIAKLQQVVHELMYPSTASPVVEDDSTRRRLEAQLELTTSELDRERELIKAQALDIDQLKDEIKRLHRVSVCSSSDYYQLRSELQFEIEDKRRIMEESNAALEIQSRLEEENERIKLTNDKTQRDLADVLRKLSAVEKKECVSDLLIKNQNLEEEVERLQIQQKQTEHECMRLMDELLAIEKVESIDSEQEMDDRMYRREIEQLRLQVAREVKRYEDLEQSKEAKIHRLHKELSDLESLVENKVFSETELEEAIECEKRKVRLLEGRLHEEEEKNRHIPMHVPMSPTSPQYSLFHQQQKRSSTGSFSLMTSTSMDTVSDHGNLLESIYCEICEEYGHEVITCNALVGKVATNDYDPLPVSSYYCVNCDIFGAHPTEDCPNQDEMF